MFDIFVLIWSMSHLFTLTGEVGFMTYTAANHQGAIKMFVTGTKSERGEKTKDKNSIFEAILNGLGRVLNASTAALLLSLCFHSATTSVVLQR